MAGFTGWEQAVLKGIGAPATPSNLKFLQAWQRAEGGGASFNPLNTTQDAPGASSFNTVGVKNYRSAQQGIDATVKTLLNGYYGSIVSGMRSGAHPGELAAAVGKSPWGTSGATIASVLGSGVTVPAAQQSSVVPSSTPSTKLAVPKTPAIPDLTPAVLKNLSSSYSPTMQLSNLVGSLMSTPAATPASTRSSPLQPSSDKHLTRNLIGPGGGWGGSYAPATTLAKLAETFGLTPTSEKRSRKMTSSGNVSDHWTGSKSSYAYDMGGSVSEMDKAARAIARRLGINYNGGPLVATRRQNGLRFQILYRTNVGGNHFNHIHIGVRRE